MIAVVESALRDVVVLVGVPGTSEGVSGLEPGGGRLMRVGWEVCAMAAAMVEAELDARNSDVVT